MIEIIYDKNEEEKQKGYLGSIKLPKNIRQIGLAGGNRRIYIEDYVVTYLNQLAKPGNSYARGAILLGNYQKDSADEVIFISGALEAQNLELDMDETLFTENIWNEIYENIKEHFPELQVVGWFLSRMGFSVELNDKIIETHMNHFAGRDKALYIMDALEGEDAFYLYENGSLVRQTGYYIYYERNEPMQQYMIDHGQMEGQEEEVVQKDSLLIKNYRDKINDKKKEHPQMGIVRFVYAGSAMLTLAVLALGITVLNNYDKMKAMEQSISKVNLVLNQDGSEENNSEEKNSEVENTQSTEQQTASVVSVGANVSTQDTENLEADPKEEEEKPDTQTVINTNSPVYYTVQDGDTLTSISKKMYQSSAYINDIAKANQMDAKDRIYAGQKIIIPSIDKKQTAE